jgi:hypothetical protein
MERVSVPKPETREVCTACGQVDGYHLQKCRISELQAEVERLRNCYATEVRTAQAYLRRTEQSERKLSETVAALKRIASNTCCDTCREAALVAQEAINEATK